MGGGVGRGLAPSSCPPPERIVRFMAGHPHRRGENGEGSLFPTAASSRDWNRWGTRKDPHSVIMNTGSGWQP